MTRYIVDTSTWIDFSKIIEPVSGRLLQLLRGPDEVGTCGVIVAEFFSGIQPSEHRSWRWLFAGLTYWDSTPSVAIQAGIYRWTYARIGRQIAVPDSLIAAVARQEGAIILTDNVRDFPMPDIAVHSLRS